MVARIEAGVQTGLKSGEVLVYHRRKGYVVVYDSLDRMGHTRPTREFRATGLLRSDADFEAFVHLVARIQGFSVRRYSQCSCGPAFVLQRSSS